MNNGVKKRIELEVVGVFECVYTYCPLLLYSFWFVASYPYLSSLVLGPIASIKDLLIWTCICFWVLILEACQVCLLLVFLSALSWYWFTLNTWEKHWLCASVRLCYFWFISWTDWLFSMYWTAWMILWVSVFIDSVWDSAYAFHCPDFVRIVQLCFCFVSLCSLSIESVSPPWCLSSSLVFVLVLPRSAKD